MLPTEQLLRLSLSWMAASAVMLVGVGCGRGDSRGEAEPTTLADGEAEETPAAQTLFQEPASDEALIPSEEEPLVAASWREIEALLTTFRGRPVVVDFWATSCLPCVEELPQLEVLRQEFGDRVVCLAVSTDYSGQASRPPEFYRERVSRVLDVSHFGGLRYLCTTPADVLFERLQLASIPVVRVYGSDGVIVQQFDSSLMTEEKMVNEEEPFTYQQDVLPLVRSLIVSSTRR